MATLPFLPSDCSCFPLHFQLACNYTNSWYIYYSSQRKGNKRTKVGGEEGSFLGSSGAAEIESVSSTDAFYIL